MIYEWQCDRCQHIRTEIMSMKEVIPPVQDCPECAHSMHRLFSAPQLIGTKNEFPEYNPAFGAVVKNKYDRAEKAKQNGWVEAGNESTDALASAAKKNKDHTYNHRWDSAISEVL